MSIDPFVDSLRDRSPRGVRCGVAKANAARGEAVPPKHARDVLDTAEDVWWAAPTHLAVAEQIRNGDSTAASQKSIGFCEHTADVGHQRDHPRQQYDIGEAVGKRCVVCAPLEHVQVREGARGRSACAVHRIDCVDGRVSSPTKPLTDPTCSRTEVHDHVDGRWQRRFERVEHRWEGWARTHDSDHVLGSETERVRTLEPPERWLIEDFRNSSVERHIERNAAPGPGSNSAWQSSCRRTASPALTLRRCARPGRLDRHGLADVGSGGGRRGLCGLIVIALRRVRPTRARIIVMLSAQELALMASLYSVWRLARVLPLARLRRCHRPCPPDRRLATQPPHADGVVAAAFRAAARLACSVLQRLLRDCPCAGIDRVSGMAVRPSPRRVFAVAQLAGNPDGVLRRHPIRPGRAAAIPARPRIHRSGDALRHVALRTCRYGVSDQFAAMPSIHVGWAAVVSFGIVAASTSRWRWLFLLHLILTMIVVSATGNHWWLDGIVAIVLLVVGIAIDARGSQHHEVTASAAIRRSLEPRPRRRTR